MKKLILITTLLSSLYLSEAQQLKALNCNNKKTVLNGRAFFFMPDSIKQEGRVANVMSADYNNNEETRFVFDQGKMRLVLFAKELYLKAGADFKTTLNENNKTKNINTKILTDKDSIISILSTPNNFNKTKEAILINSLLVKTPDNTLFRFDAYINLEAFELKNEFIILTEKIFSSLAKGNRANNLKERTELLPTLNEKAKLSFKIPQDYCITIDKKYDFQVYKFHKFKSLSESNEVEDLIIYTGFYPSMIYKDLNLTEVDAKKIKGQFLGKEIEWLQFEAKDQGIIVKEQLFSEERIEKNLKIHVAIISNQQKTIDKLSAIVADIKLVNQ